MKNFRLQSMVMLAALILIPVTVAYPQTPVKWSLRAEPVTKTVRPGERLSVQLVADMEAGWHLYSVTQMPGGPSPTRITVPAGQQFKLGGEIESSPALIEYDQNFGIETEFFVGSAAFALPIAVARECPSGSQNLRVDVFYQTCNSQFCLPATTVKLETPISVAPGTDERGFLSFIWLAAGMGALSLLTPCVFPMIPITVSYFVSHSADSRGKALRNSGFYSGGIILTFTGLGMALALLGGASGLSRFASSPWTNLLITFFFLGFAILLFEIYQIRLPSTLLTRLDSISRHEGGSQMAGMLLTGLVFTLTSFTCTAPFIGTLLVMAAQGQWQWPLVGMLVFSTVFALPFFVLSVMPQLLSQMPRSGGWLKSVKIVMGFLELGAALKFLSNADLVWHWGIFTRNVVIAGWAAMALLIALHLLGRLRMSQDPLPERIGAARWLTALFFLALGSYLTIGLAGRRLGEIESFLPPAPEVKHLTAASKAAGELSWMINDYEGALVKARDESKLVLIDFTGYTCTNCRWMEANMFPNPEVKRKMEKYVRVRLYTDGAGEICAKNQKLEQDKFGTVALPYYAVIDSEGNPVASFAGLTRNPAEFISFLIADRSSAQPYTREIPYAFPSSSSK